MSPPKFVDLFCGLGSFHFSLRRLGWNCVLASDNDNTLKDLYQKNFGITPKGDIYDISAEDIPEYDVLCAGWPCQPWSQAGKKKGFKDERGTLFLEILRIVKSTNPKVIILENVPALKKHDEGRTFSIISKELSDHGYTIQTDILKCSDFGIPQMRKRLFMVCVRNDLTNMNVFDLEEHKNDLSLSDFLGKNFKKQTAYTIRCGGRRSGIDNRHNWDTYMVDDQEYSLTVDDAKKLQGFGESFVLSDTPSHAWRHLGNTIPTNLTYIVGKKVDELLSRQIM